MNHPRPASSHQVRRRRVLLAAAALAALVLLAPLPAQGATDDPSVRAATPAASAAPTTPSTLRSKDALPVSVSITAITPQVLQPGEDLTVTATVRNDSTEEIAAPRASVRIHRFRLATRAELDSWAQAGPTDTAGTVAGSTDLAGPLAPGASAQVTVTVPAADIGLLRTPDAWGPRGIAVEITSGRLRLGLARSFLLWLSSDDVTQTRVSVLTPLVGPVTDPSAPSASGDGTSPSPEPTGSPSSADPVARLRAVLSATSAHPEVSWAVDPALLAESADGSPAAREWLTALVSGTPGRDVLALPWSDPDLAALAHADRADLLDVALTTAGSVADTGADAAAASAMASIWSGGRSTVLWAADDVPDQQTATLAAGSSARALVVGPDAMAADDSTDVTPSGRAEISTSAGPLTALVPDATLSGLLEDPAAAQPGATAATSAQRMLAETAVLARERTSGVQHVLATTSRTWVPDVPVVRAELDALAAAPWVRLSPVSGLLGSSDDGIDRTALPERDVHPDELSADEVGALGDAHAAVVSFATVVADPTSLLAGFDQEVLAPLSVAWRADPAGRSAAVAQVVADAADRRSGLSVLLNDQFTVISQSTQIRLAVASDLDQDATVRVQMVPRKACIQVTGPDEVVAAAGAETTVTFDVRANANCDVTVDVTVTSTDGTVVAAPVDFTARVAPTIENVGTAVVGALLAIGLVVGVVRTARRGRSARRGIVVSPPAPGPEDPA
ncbi:hypothetical protein AGMMS50218_03810 [Actinomycetota bacterium]|nr:hypothetical protein AGMMS50218_03810 [Actinomycetota bacterium]